jgi:peptidoglycan hydrolase-like protein with peptidoglycan-binding domain
LENQTNYAINDKSISVIDGQIDRVTKARNTALLNDDQELASTYDLHLQALNNAKSETNIQKGILDAAVATVSGQSNAVGLLDYYNQKISSSSSGSPVSVNGVTYQSEKDFWTFKRDSYVADNTNSGFFGRFGDEQNTKIKIANSNNSLSVDTINDVSKNYNILTTRTELTPYIQTLTATRQDSLQTGADYIGDKILNTYSVDYDLPAANAKLEALKPFGVNTDKVYGQIMTNAANVKSSQVSNILQTANSIMSSNPALTPAQAVSQAIAQGASVVMSPKDLTSKNEKTLATDMATGNENKSFTTDTRTTLPGENVPATPTANVAMTKQLDLGVKDPEVIQLQKFLNNAGFSVASAGKPGSAGMETDYFGPETQAALKKFQASQGVVTTGDPTTTGFGRVGPQTLTAIQNFKPTANAATPAPQPNPQLVNNPISTSAPASNPTPASGGQNGYTFKETPTGSVEVYQNGSRITTAAKSYAASAYGYTG